MAIKRGVKKNGGGEGANPLDTGMSFDDTVNLSLGQIKDPEAAPDGKWRGVIRNIALNKGTKRFTLFCKAKEILELAGDEDPDEVARKIDSYTDALAGYDLGRTDQLAQVKRLLKDFGFDETVKLLVAINALKGKEATFMLVTTVSENDGKTYHNIRGLAPVRDGE